MISSISFTASRELGAPHPIPGVVPNVLCQLPFADRYVTGGCVGGDAFLGTWLYANRPEADHLVVVPHDRRRVDPWWEYTAEPDRPVKVLQMPFGTDFKDHNARLVREGNALWGFPAYEEDDPRSERSGSWQTILMARRRGTLVQWHCVTPPYKGKIVRRLNAQGDWELIA